MTPLLLPVLALLLLGGIGTAWCLGVWLPQRRRVVGLRALSALHWRELQSLVIAALRERGFHRIPQDVPSTDDGLIELDRDGSRWLLSTKHGTAYVLGPAAVTEFANAVHLRGAVGGWMATPGAITAENAALARVQKIELLDGRALWDEIAPLLPPEQRAAILAPVRALLVRTLVLVWGLALVSALAAWVLAGYLMTPPATQAPPALEASTPRAPIPAGRGGAVTEATRPTAPPPASSAADQSSPAPAATPAEESSVVPTDPAILQQRRAQIASALASLPNVARAAWSTQSTLIVQLATDTDVDKQPLCVLLERYPELRTSRMQLQPPQGSQRPVRFIQCRTY